jgi:hypothetical protein
MSSSHLRTTVIQILPQTEVRKNSKVGLTQMNKDRNLQNRVGIQANPPRAKLLRRKNSDIDKVEKIRLRNNRHMITCERQLAVEINRRNDHSSRTLVLSLGCHHNLIGGLSGSEIKGKQRMFGGKKVRLGLRTQSRAAK